MILVLTLAMVLATAAPALAKERDVNIDLRSSKTAAVTAGDTAWVAIDWLAKGGDAEDFAVEAEVGNGVGVWYPYKSTDTSGSPETFTSLMGDSTLSESEVDFTAIRLDVPYDVPKNIDLILTVTYKSNGETHREVFKAKVPVAYYDGQDLQQVTADVGPIPAGVETWVSVDYKGFAPRLDDVSVTATGGSELTIVYPSKGTEDNPIPGTFTSLRRDSTLDDNETDDVAFRVAASEPGTYVLSLEVTYAKDGAQSSMTGSVTVTVAGAPPG